MNEGAKEMSVLPLLEPGVIGELMLMSIGGGPRLESVGEIRDMALKSGIKIACWPCVGAVGMMLEYEWG